VITANPSSTSKENVEGWAHTSFGYLPISGTPSVSPSTNTWGDFQTSFLPFVVGGTINSANEDLAEVLVPGGYFNTFGSVHDVCVTGSVATAVAASVLRLNLTMTNNYAQNPVVVSTARRRLGRAEIETIRLLRSQGKSVRQLAKDFGASQWMIARLEPAS
jgi:hypothetical protein